MLFTIARKVIGSVILAADKMTSPKPPSRSAEEQAALDKQTSQLVVFEMLACPFCVKVRREIRRLGMNIELRDVKKNQSDMQTLVNEGGKFQVPCLRIESSEKTTWLYESNDIIKYLQQL